MNNHFCKKLGSDEYEYWFAVSTSISDDYYMNIICGNHYLTHGVLPTLVLLEAYAESEDCEKFTIRVTLMHATSSSIPSNDTIMESLMSIAKTRFENLQLPTDVATFDNERPPIVKTIVCRDLNRMFRAVYISLLTEQGRSNVVYRHIEYEPIRK